MPLSSSGTRQFDPNSFSSERLRYIKIDAKDKELADFLHKNHNDPELMRVASTGPIRPEGPSDVEKFIAGYNRSIIGVAICFPAEVKDLTAGKLVGQVVGVIGLMPTVSLDMVTNRRATLGVWLAKEFRGQKYGEEAINWILDWGFSQVGLHAIDLDVAGFNDVAIQVYRNLGFVEEGRRRDYVYYDRKWYDSLIFSMLESEWEKLRAKTVYSMD